MVTIERATEEDLEINNDENVPQTTPNTEKRTRKRNKAGSDENLEKILRTIENDKEPSAIATFFMSLAKQAEELSRPQQLVLQKKCLQALEDVEMDFLN